MSCSHPNELLERVEREDGTLGLRCRGCGFTAWAGDRFLKTLVSDIIRRVRSKGGL